MKVRGLGGLVTVFLFAVALATTTSAQQGKTQFEPQVGQAGKDVVWVPTPQAVVDKMLEMAKLTASDYLIDLGSGDGRLVITAAKRGARAHGIEYNPDMVELSKKAAEKEGVTQKATFAKADIFESDFSQASVITMFLLPSLNLKLRPTILDLKPGTRIVSNTFTMEDWTADDTFVVTEGCSSYCTSLLWIVPAKVAGSWRLSDGQLTLQQTFQMVSGTLTAGGKSTPISNGKLRGDQVTFTVGATEYTGRVAGNAIQGATKTGTTAGSWSAAKM